MRNNYLIPVSIILAGAIIGFAIIAVNNPQDKSFSGQEEQKEEKVVYQDSPSAGGSKEFSITKTSHVKGDFNAPITIVEYSDFQCPFCAKFHPTVEQILDEYPGQVRWVYKHFPLSFHQEARSSAEASECAAEQSKFWEYAKGLFENQSQLGSAFYSQLASQIGLNVSQFEDCVSSRKYKDKVEADFQEGQRNGVKGTPGSFINGELVSGAVPYSSLKTIIDKKLADQ